MNRIAVVIQLLAFFLCIGCSGSKKKDEAAGGFPQPIETPEYSSHKSQDSRPVIVAFGDSLTAGLGVEPDQNYPAKLQVKIDGNGYGYRVVNAGISGETSSQGLNRLEAIRALHPAVVIVEFGANDGLRGLPVAATRQNLEEIVNGFLEGGTEIVIAGMQMPPNYGPEYTKAFHSIFTDVAAKYHTALVPFFLEGVGGHPELNQGDGIHPTAKGYDIVVENVWNTLEPVLKKTGNSSFHKR